MRLLLVEDHVPLADELLASLGRQGYAVDWLADGRDAAFQGACEPYDLIILDLGLPGKPGLEVLQEWRAGGISAPVLILTARGSWAERIEGLAGGRRAPALGRDNVASIVQALTAGRAANQTAKQSLNAARRNLDDDLFAA